MKELPGKNLSQSTEADPMDDMEAKGHLDTLMQAHGIMNDGAKMEKVHALAGRHAAALKGLKKLASPKAPKIKSLDDLKAHANNMMMDKDQDGE